MSDMNILAQIWINNSSVTRMWVPCRICGNPTSMCGTKLCDGCYEIHSRLKSFLRCTNAIRFVQDTLKEVLNEAT